MLRKENFTEKHIRELQKTSKRDPILLERTVYAFGLLEAITRVGMPFIFKGGSCLMLLLKEPKRLSTDIDIIVAPETPVDEYIEKASIIFPFSNVTEQKRFGKNNIEKRHFKFTYDSPINEKPFYILLDILFENNHYANLVKRPIKHSLLLTDADDFEVNVPDADCILGDKLTAFAPHTTGIPLNAGKDIEVIKQLYDVCSLLEVFQSFDKVSLTYEKVVKSEIDYRGIHVTSKDTLLDTLKAAVCVGSRGAVYGEEYPTYVKGIRDLRDHIYSEKYSPEIAAVQAIQVMYMAACLMTGQSYEKVIDFSEFINVRLRNNSLIPFKYLRKAAPIEYAYLIKTDRILAENGIAL